MKVFITGADHGLGLATTKKMLERGFTVFAGQYDPDWQELSKLQTEFPINLHIIPIDISRDDSVAKAAMMVKNITAEIDVIIGNAGIIGWDYDVYEDITDTQMMSDVYNVNALGNVRVVEHFLPLLNHGTTRKICFVSSEAGSIENSGRDNFFWYSMSKAALNSYAKTLFNRHRKDDFKFRLYHPGWIKTYMHGKFNDAATYTAEDAANFALDYFFDAIVNEDEFVLYTYDKEKMPF